MLFRALVSSILYHWPARSKATAYHRLVRRGFLLTTFQKGSALNFSSGVLSAHCSVTHLRTISRDFSRSLLPALIAALCSSLSGTPVLAALIFALRPAFAASLIVCSRINAASLNFALRIAFVASLIVCSRTIAASLSFCRVS